MMCAKVIIEKSSDIMNYGFLTTETNSNALYIFHGFHHLISKAIFKEYPSSYGSSLVTLQIFVYKSLFTMFFGKRNKEPHETFHIFSHFHISLKMNAPFEKNHFLKMNACFWKSEK